MKETRAKEYADHFEHMEITLKGLPEWPSSSAIRQADLEIIHSCIDEALNVARMILKDLGHELADDKQNMETLQEEFILTDAMMDRMSEALAFKDLTISGALGLDGIILMEKIEHVKFTLIELMDLFKEVIEDDLAD